MGYQCKQQQVLHFRQPTLPLTDAIFTLGVMQIPIVKRYTYLGIIVDEFTTYHDTVQAKIEKATGAFYVMVAQLRQIGGASHRVYKNLFDSMIASVLDYGTPMWSRFAGNREIEKVQNLAYRESVGNILWQLPRGICAGCLLNAGTS